MFASTATTPFSSTISGLISIAVIHGSSQTISEMRNSTSSSAFMSTAGMLRNSPRRVEMRVERIMSLTRKLLSGGRATATSRFSSTRLPPSPKVIAGPNTGSRRTLTTSSRPLRFWIIGSIAMPLITASGCTRLTSSRIS